MLAACLCGSILLAAAIVPTRYVTKVLRLTTCHLLLAVIVAHVSQQAPHAPCRIRDFSWRFLSDLVENALPMLGQWRCWQSIGSQCILDLFTVMLLKISLL